MPINKANYPPDWKQISLHIRFTRAGGKCEMCGAAHGELVERTWRDGIKRQTKIALETAHLNRDTTDNREENLAALCQRCHLMYDRFEHARSRWNNRVKKFQFTGRLFDGNN